MLHRYALVSCYDKTGLTDVCSWLLDCGWGLISTGGTSKFLSEALVDKIQHPSQLLSVADVTDFPEILNGRVKTLHPLIHGALLADRTNANHIAQMKTHAIPNIEMVICNLYPFWRIKTEEISHQEAIELIDIGGVTMLRAAAKNYQSITVISDPSQYAKVINHTTDAGQELRQTLAKRVFELTSQYDTYIAEFMGSERVTRFYTPVSTLKYGCNPHQTPSILYSNNSLQPPSFTLLNGEWGYINILDAVGCWGLVRELSTITGRVAACSFKHTSPAGAAISIDYGALPQSSRYVLEKLYGLTAESSPAVNAYVRARNADPQSSFGDFIGVSDTVDQELAKVISNQISDGIVAPGYTVEALEILRAKKGGKYIIIGADNTVPVFTGQEFRELCGFAISQPANIQQIDTSDLVNIVTHDQTALNGDQMLNLIVANCSLKYAQSNNVACATQHQLIGLSAGQQSRVHSVRLACQKATVWKRRHHNSTLALMELLPSDIRRQERINVTTDFAQDQGAFIRSPPPYLMDKPMTIQLLSADQNTNTADDIVMASDAFFPFSDSIDIAHEAGVTCISQPGGSTRDQTIIDHCNKYKIKMVFTGKRIFTH